MTAKEPATKEQTNEEKAADLLGRRGQDKLDHRELWFTRNHKGHQGHKVSQGSLEVTMNHKGH